MQIKPNRLVFQERPGQSEQLSKIAMATKPLKDLEEQVQKSESLAYQRTLALESFRRSVRAKSNVLRENLINFKGNDSSGAEIYANPNFQYTYEQLDEFFRQNTSEKYPINLQKEWMNKVVEWTISWLQGNCATAISLTKDDIDTCMLGLQRFNTPSDDYSDFKYALYSPGPFKEWIKANYPDEYQSIFGN